MAEPMRIQNRTKGTVIFVIDQFGNEMASLGFGGHVVVNPNEVTFKSAPTPSDVWIGSPELSPPPLPE
jgi:hypothetical protein